MSNTKLSALTELVTVASNDQFYVNDVSDTTGSSSGTSKKIQYSNLTSGLATVPVTVANGGTGLQTLTSGSVLVGNGTSAVTLVATTGSSNFVRATSPTLVTPVLGAATATSINGLTLTSSTGTFTLTNLKTFAVTNTITLSGTDSTVMTFPNTTTTVAGLGIAQTFTATQTQKQINYTINAITASGNAATVPITSTVNNVTNNSAATLTITMTTTSAVDGQLSEVRIYDFSGVAQTVSWVNTENSSVSVPATSNGSTTLPLSVLFQFNSGSSKWRCLASS